jgi:phage tail sheath protein FI
MAQRLMTPGVYIEEVNAFPGSVVEVATAIPAFIGYTEKASRNGKSLVNQPVRITSHAEYLQLFGGAFNPKFTLAIQEGKSNNHQITVNGQAKAINFATNHDLYMYRGIQLFFSNGGGTCYIVSVGTYEGNSDGVEVKKDELEAGVDTLLKEQEPTMVIIPDAVKLGDESYDVYKKVLAHCAKMQSRVAIFDIHNGYQNRIVGDASVDIITNFREKIGTEYLSYSAAYYPWLNTSIVQKGEITFDNLASSENLENLLPDTESAALALVKDFPKNSDEFITRLAKDKPVELEEALNADLNQPKEPIAPVAPEEPALPVEPKKLKDSATPEEKAAYDKQKAEYDALKANYDVKKAEYDTLKAAFDSKNAQFKTIKTDYDTKKAAFDTKKNAVKNSLSASLADDSLKVTKKLLADYITNKKLNYHQGLIATSPTYSNLLDEIRTVMNLLPPASAMAGIYTMVDNNRGVWKSPANISLNAVIKPSSNITHDEQENLNVDALSGKSINAIRTFPGIGTLVWGGRTLDGNSLDWKYINVRRTMIMLEQSIKMALRSYVFEPNDANTWVTVKSMIVNYLTEKWKQGALAGASPEDAFDVQIGLGITMTGLDILEGRMLISVKLAIVRPAEFIVVRFEQQMQKS